MDDRTRDLLRAHLDGILPPERHDELRALLEDDPEAARYVDEHRRLWSLLGEAYAGAGAEPSDAFRERTVAASRAAAPAAPRWRRWTLAAALLLAVGLAVLRALSPTAPGRVPLTAEEREVVHSLHVLQHFDTLERHGTELDLLGAFDVMRAFAGELEGEG
jgi:anti-sigma factor RsiW